MEGVHRSRQVVLLLALWSAATVFGLAFAAWTAVGPVVLVFSRGHGVHVGDLVALVAAYSTAAVLTRRIRQPA
jgi:nitrate/nitrite transporter NarK